MLSATTTKSTKRILMVAPYPIKKPYHGGQKRAAAIFRLYKEHFAEARFVGIFHSGHYIDRDEQDIVLSDLNVIARINANPYATELIVGRSIDDDAAVRDAMTTLLSDYKPDVIHIEQPYLYLSLSSLLPRLLMHPTLIFGSQNIEYTMKQKIFSDLSLPGVDWDNLVEQVRELEYSFSQKADLVIAVNKEDAETHKQMGAKRVVVAPNGIEKRRAPVIETERWTSYKQAEGLDTLATFVSSAHLPNSKGFLATIGEDTSFVPKGSRIMIAGGIADYFASKFGSGTAFWTGAKNVGALEDDSLAALITCSEVILLPITTERGSNLKTAEAILSRRKIVATDYAFHGFERYRSLPNIFIANDKAAFQRAIVDALKANYINPSKEDVLLSEQVQWRYCLLPILPDIDAISYKSRLREITESLHLRIWAYLRVIKRRLNTLRKLLG